MSSTINYDDYKEEAQNFIVAAFDLLKAFNTLASYYEDTTISIDLADPYELRINTKGRLYLVKCDDFTEKGWILIGHAYGNKYSQITYVGKLLADYLEHLQKDNE